MSQIISLDIGTGFVKACSIHNRVRFPSLYAYRDTDPWENGKKNGTIIEGSGYDAVNIAKHPSAVILRPVREGIPSNKTAFMAVVKQAIKNLEISNDDILETSIIIGLPYHAAKDATKFPSFVRKITNCRDVIVVPQTIGTLMASERKDGIVLAIGQGTTEIVAFDNLKPILGRSIPQACDYVYQGANDLEHLNSNNLSFQMQ